MSTSPSPAAKKTPKPAVKKPVAKKAVAKKVIAKMPAAKKPAAKKSTKPTKAAAPKSKPVAKPTPVTKPKTKLVRDSFTMPQSDFALIDVLKSRALNMKHPVKKSELLRAGLQSLQALDDLRLLVVLETLEPLKAGRPKKD